MNTRQTIEVLKRKIKAMALLLGASLTVRTRAFGDGPDRAAVRTLREGPIFYANLAFARLHKVEGGRPRVMTSGARSPKYARTY
jgi:hypothetical protein